MAKFVERDNDLDAIARETSKWISVIDNAIAEFTRAKDGLAALQSRHSALVTEINNAASANPDDEAIQDQKRRMDKYVADFLDVKTRATDAEAAVSGI